MATSTYNAEDYEKRYREGYGLQYPESHIIRVNKQILEWQLGMRGGGKAFDFGCGAGAHLRYFAEQGYEPFGCDTSATAIDAARQALPKWSANLKVTPVNPDLPKLFGGDFKVFLSNQVLYFLDDADIALIVAQAHRMVAPGGVLIATMMAPTCWYARYIQGERDGFKVVRLDTPRQKGELLINFKAREQMKALFAPFTPLHVGSYGSHVREEEGPTDHWIFVGRREGGA